MAPNGGHEPQLRHNSRFRGPLSGQRYGWSIIRNLGLKGLTSRTFEADLRMRLEMNSSWKHQARCSVKPLSRLRSRLI